MPINYAVIALQSLFTTVSILIAAVIGYKLLKPRLIQLINDKTQTLEARMMNAAPKIMQEMVKDIDVGEIVGKIGGEEGGEGGLGALGSLLGGSKGGLGDLTKLLSLFSGQKQGGGGESW